VVERFDRVCIDVPDLEEAVAQYLGLFGEAPARLDSNGPAAAWLALANTVIELRQGERAEETGKARIRELVFASTAAGKTELSCDNSLGLSLGLGDGSSTREFRAAEKGGQRPAIAVDHLVLRTGDAQACVELFRDELGIRLALDKTVPEWGGRMLFFRAGKLTLEVIQAEDQPADKHFFWGIAYQCTDIESTAAAMQARGVTLSEIREGRKPGTRVATVKTHCLGIPTLLIEPVKS